MKTLLEQTFPGSEQFTAVTIWPTILSLALLVWLTVLIHNGNKPRNRILRSIGYATILALTIGAFAYGDRCTEKIIQSETYLSAETRNKLAQLLERPMVVIGSISIGEPKILLSTPRSSKEQTVTVFGKTVVCTQLEPGIIVELSVPQARRLEQALRAANKLAEAEKIMLACR